MKLPGDNPKYSEAPVENLENQPNQDGPNHPLLQQPEQQERNTGNKLNISKILGKHGLYDCKQQHEDFEKDNHDDNNFDPSGSAGLAC